MRILTRSLFALVFVAAFLLLAFLLHGPKKIETWATVTALLAVIAAVIAALPALRVLELQEEATRPRPTPYFDLTSRHHLLQLRVKNLGGGIAYDVHLHWKAHPVDHKGEKVRSLDHIVVLLPQESASTLVGALTYKVKELSDTRFEGECSFRDASGRKYRQDFICSVDGNLRQLTHDNELPKTLHDLQQVPIELSRIADQLEKLEALRSQVSDSNGSSQA